MSTDSYAKKPVSQDSMKAQSRIPTRATRRLDERERSSISSLPIRNMSSPLQREWATPQIKAAASYKPSRVVIDEYSAGSPAHHVRPHIITFSLGVLCGIVLMVVRPVIMQGILYLLVSTINAFKQQEVTNILQNVVSIITIFTVVLIPACINAWKHKREAKVIHRKYPNGRTATGSSREQVSTNNRR